MSSKQVPNLTPGEMYCLDMILLHSLLASNKCETNTVIKSLGIKWGEGENTPGLYKTPSAVCILKM